MNTSRLAPWRRLVGALGALTAVCAVWDAPAGLTVFLLVLTAAAVAGYLAVRVDQPAADEVACGKTAPDRTAAESPGGLGWISTTTPLPPPSPEELAAWSDLTLCQAWRVSYVRLRRQQLLPQPSPGIARVARERAAYLNEIERRYPEGFSAWMAAGARAPSDPTRFLVRRVVSRGVENR